ncbi:MAG: 4Fe-4S dicluster domain-containing protein [Acidimicrobiales bacterium]
MEPRLLGLAHLQALLDTLALDHRVMGPRVADGVIGWGPLASVDELPVGAHDHQAPGRYRLTHDPDDPARFGWAVGPQTIKPIVHPPEQPVWSITHDADGFHVAMAEHRPEPLVLFGARPCEVAAVHLLEHVLVEGPHHDPGTAARRADRVIVAVDCGRPATTCFCASMGAGPRCDTGADLALTELPGPADPSGPVDPAGVRYVARALSDRGAALLDALDAPVAGPDEIAAAASAVDAAADAQVRRIDRDGIPALLRDGAELSTWDDVATRCLTCGNCTAVCPTCFCTDVHDLTSLDGAVAERSRHWDSCFSLQFSRIAGHPVRTSVRSRYRQWLTHKLGTWWDQFGSSGCVGCGRCITWCPVGIDLAAEAAALTAEAATRHSEEGSS